MKIQEVILRAMSGQLKWTQAADILGISPRSLRRWKRRYELDGYIGFNLVLDGIGDAINGLLGGVAVFRFGVMRMLLLGAVLGLWPFQQGVAPKPGDIVRGRVMTEATITELDAEDYPLERFSPTGGQVGAVVAIYGYGLFLDVEPLDSARRLLAFWNTVAAVAKSPIGSARGAFQIHLADDPLPHHHWRPSRHLHQVVPAEVGGGQA